MRRAKETEVLGRISERAGELNEAGLFARAEFDPKNAERTGFSNYSYWRETLRIFLKKKTAVVLSAVMLLLIAFILIQPYLPNQKDPLKIYINPETGVQYRNIPPGDLFFLGSNNIGQDLWARIWSATRTSLFISMLVALFNAAAGIAVGALWGYVRKLDRFITEVYNVINNIPDTIVLILLTYIMKPGIKTIIFAMCATGWISMARFIRNQIIIIRDREYNLASRCLGSGAMRIIARNLLPYLVSVIAMRIALSIPYAIGGEIFLTYIGLGLPVDVPSLGNLINEGRMRVLLPSQRYQLIFPALALSIITISFYVIGSSFADAADPKNHVG